MGFLSIALLMGVLVPIQTAANARMRASIGQVWVVTLISFLVSSLLLAVISSSLGIPLLPSAGQIADTPWWGWTGGLIALCTITITICLFRAIGQLQTTILPLLGQLLFSLVIDHFGLFGSVRIPSSTLRMVAMLLLVVGVLLVVVIPNLRKKETTHAASRHTLLWQLSAIIAGCLMASIGAIYGRLGLCLESGIHPIVFHRNHCDCGLLHRERQTGPYAHGLQKRESVVDVAGRYMRCHRRVWQFMADTTDWSRRIFHGPAARADAT